MMAPPNRAHQRLIWKLHQIIANYIDSRNGNCEVYAAPFAVFLNADDKTYVKPDIKYRTAGVKKYWIIDHYTFSDYVKAGIYDDLNIDFSNINFE